VRQVDKHREPEGKSFEENRDYSVIIPSRLGQIILRVTGCKEPSRNSVGQRSGPCHAVPIEPSRISVRGNMLKQASRMFEYKLSDRSNNYFHRGEKVAKSQMVNCNLKSLAFI